MKDFILVFVLIFAVQVHGEPKTAPAVNMVAALEGKWNGFCSPDATKNTSKMCHYNFVKGAGDYQCTYYTDLRCTKKDSKTTSYSFRFSAQTTNEKNLKLSIEYDERPDIRQEKMRAYITGKVLRLQMYEVFRFPDVKTEDLEAQGVIPFFEFTKAAK